MMNSLSSELEGLTILFGSSFPKTCANCGRVYQNAKQFLRKTEPLPRVHSGLKEAIEEDGTVIVEVFRNCICGSTLMDEFNNRRDFSERGGLRREKFARLVLQLVNQGLSQHVAREELIKLMKGNKSKIINEILSSIEKSRD